VVGLGRKPAGVRDQGEDLYPKKIRARAFNASLAKAADISHDDHPAMHAPCPVFHVLPLLVFSLAGVLATEPAPEHFQRQ